MSYKSANGIKMTRCDSQHLDTNVKLAGEEAKDRLYEPKHKKKLVRVLTVVAYVFFVSLAAIMLSLYYVFLWNGDQKIATKHDHYANQHTRCDVIAEKQITSDIAERLIDNFGATPSPDIEETTIWYPDENKSNILIEKLVNYASYDDID